MKKRLLFCVLAGALTACQREGDVQPTSVTLADEVVGLYRTNFYVDPSCVALSANQMAYVELKKESDSAVTLVYTKQYPAKASHLIQHISLNHQTNGVQLQIGSSSIGTLQTDRVFTDNGMEKQGKLLRLTILNDPQALLNFTGVKQ